MKSLPIKDIIPYLMPGDRFGVQSDGILSRAIRFGQALEGDDPCPINHIGGLAKAPNPLFVSDGTTIESRWKIDFYHIREYVGKRIIIARHNHLTVGHYFKGVAEVEDNIGQIYPVLRIPLLASDMIRGVLYKRIFNRRLPFRVSSLTVHGDWPVCSELWAQFDITAGLETGYECSTDCKGWKGVTPEDHYDAWNKRPDLYKILFDGILLGG